MSSPRDGGRIWGIVFSDSPSEEIGLKALPAENLEARRPIRVEKIGGSYTWLK